MGVESRYGLKFGYMDHGPRNLITDVPGVRVGHVTLHDGEVHTGVTAIIPHTGDVFHEKCLAGAHVINGFGKSIGLVQVQELGTLETPILLTNTLSVGTVSTALVEYMLERNDDIGLDAGTVNSLVMECNDARLSDIRGLHVTKEHARAALAAASETFAEGDVGAGAGMVCYSLKGGIGSASRLCHLYGETYTVGALVMTNFGTLRDLRVAGDPVGERLFWQEQSELKDKGSIIVIIATDVPLSSRQLERVAKRAQSGIARTGGISGNGSGEIALAFTTGNKLAHYSSDRLESIRLVYEEDIDEVFRAAIESVDEAIISSMLHAKAVTGRGGVLCPGLHGASHCVCPMRAALSRGGSHADPGRGCCFLRRLSREKNVRGTLCIL